MYLQKYRTSQKCLITDKSAGEVNNNGANSQEENDDYEDDKHIPVSRNGCNMSDGCKIENKLMTSLVVTAFQ